LIDQLLAGFCLFMRPHKNYSLKNLPQEIWEPIIGYEGIYEISSYGRMKCVYTHDIRRQKRKMFIKKTGQAKPRNKKDKREDMYVIAYLHKNGNNKSCGIHRLVAINFIPNSENKPEVNHKNGVKWDNRVDNLEWVTSPENIKHAVENGLTNSPYGEDSGMAVLSNSQVIDIFNSKQSVSYLSNKYNVHDTTVRYIKNGTNWSNITGKKYEKKKFPSQCKLITVNGVTKSYSGWAAQWGAKGNLIFSRLKSGWSEKDAVTIPPTKTGANKKLKLFKKIDKWG